MMKRTVCVFLSALLLVGTFLIPGVFAASDMKASEDCIALLKQMEGFISTPVWDVSQWSVGYGSAVTGSDVQKYKDTPITEAEADTLLRSYVAVAEKAVNQFATTSGRTLQQKEFDALILFSYNCGTAWLTESTCNFRSAVIGGKYDNNFLSAIVAWCNSGGKVNDGLIKRRLCEANVYINGIYSIDAPSDFCYVLYNGAGGTVTYPIQAFYQNNPITVLQVPVQSGYKFLGWYTEVHGGTKVYALSSSLNKTKLNAHWEKLESQETISFTNVTTTAIDSYVTVVPDETVLYQYSDVRSQALQTAAKDTVLHIVAQGSDSTEMLWGKTESGSWVLMSETSAYEEPEPSVEVTITTNFLNARRGPGTGYGIYTTLVKGTKVAITEVKKLDSTGEYWGKYNKAYWICLTYTTYEPEEEEEKKEEEEKEETTETETKEETETSTTSVKITASYLNIRKGAGTNTAVVGGLSKGSTAEISTVQKVGTVNWGEISGKGWICLTYTDYQPASEESQENTEEKTEEKTESTEEKVTSVTCEVTASALNVRKAAGTNSTVVSCLKTGSSITVTETKTVNGALWGKIGENQWVCLTYTTYTSALAEQQKSETETEEKKEDTTETKDEEKQEEKQDEQQEEKQEEEQEESEEQKSEFPKSGYVTASLLNVRSDAGTTNKIVATLSNKSAVSITEIKTVSGAQWGKISSGWICMTYVKLTDSSESSGETTAEESSGSTIYQITGSYVNVRKAAGMSASVVDGVGKGTKVTVTETKTANNLTWGKIGENRWICLSYAKKVS